MTSLAQEEARYRPPRLFAGLFDDAAMFPPGNAPTAQAVKAHLARAGTCAADYVGAFLCPGARLCELLGSLPEGVRLPLALIEPELDDLPDRLATIASDARLVLRAVETAGGGPGGVERAVAAYGRLLPEGALGYIEIPVGDTSAHTAALSGTQFRAKFRTGGMTHEAFPDERTLTAAITAAADAGVAFKLTAGLHHAVRQCDPLTGFEHHGFVNILGAVAAALDGAPTGQIEALLGERDPAAATAALPESETSARRIRTLFACFGTCSVDEPLTDLRTLRLVQDAAHAR